jgi:HEAT repeat protein
MDHFLRTALIALVAVTGPRAGTTSGDLESLWSELGTDDPVKARQAIGAFVSKADQAVPFLQKRLRPVPRPEPSRLARLIAGLDSKEFKVRESATQELQRLGEPAESALRKALANRPSPEMRRRIEQILETHKRERLHPPSEQLRQARAVEVLEQIGNPAARKLLEALSRGAPKATLTRDAEGALERLAKQPANGEN